MAAETRKEKATCVHVIHSLEYGGAQKDLYYYAKFHDRDRYRLEVVSFYPDGEMIPALEDLGLRVHVLGTRTADLRSVIGLSRIFSRSKADIVHFHSYPPVFSGVPAAELAKVPVKVVTEHSIRVRKAGGKFSDLVYSGLCRRLDVVIACSEEVRHSHSAVVGPDRIVTISNGVDLDHFDVWPSDLKTDPATYHIGTVGSLTGPKGYQYLVDTVRLLAERDIPVKLTFVGDGPLREDLEKQARRAGIGDRVVFAGKTDDVMAFLPAFDVVAGSSIREGLPLAILEAMAASRPVVTTDVGGNREAVINGVTGLLVPPGDPYALADALETLWRDKGKLASMGKEGRMRVEEHFSARTMVSKTEKLYQSILKRSDSHA
jgi:glycosyltransferase involved in cell wall biosynthesis